MRRKLLSFVFVTLLSISAFATVTSSYYSSIDGKSAVTLFNALTSLTTSKQTTTLSYTGLWTAYKTTDLNSSGKIWDMYSNCTFTYSTGQCGNYDGECDCYNREHSLPKSWWGGTASGPYTDIFHVVPTDGYVNSKRSNYPFGEVKTATYTSNAGCKLGTSNLSSYSGTVFEPQDEYKGDFARAYMAMCVRWANTNYKFTTDEGSSIFNTTFTSAGNYGLTAYGVELLMKWHRADPVSQKEIDRNNGIESVQGNRNPFIDYPCLAEYLWGEHKDETFNLSSMVGSFESAFVVGSSSGCSSSSSGTGGGSDSGTDTDTGTSTTYTKLTSAPSDWSGEYLIVYEDGSLILNGSLTTLDAIGNTQSVTISNSTITTSSDYAFTIAASGTSYTIKSASGYYMGRDAASNGLNASTSTTYLNTLSIASGVATITGAGGCYLRYNSNSGQTRFRYYTSTSTGQNIALYKKNTSSTTTKATPTISFNNPTTSLTVGASVTNVATTNSTGAITYSSNNTGVATVNSSTGAVTAVAAGTTIITATVAETASYYSASATYTLTVTNASSGDSGSTETTDGDYVKVTENLSDWSGDYVIVYENGSRILNGGGTINAIKDTSNYVIVTITNNTISAAEGDPCRVSIAPVTNGYSIKTLSGYYLTGSLSADSVPQSGNYINGSGTTVFVNSIEYANDCANIVDAAGNYMRYNMNSGQTRFRYYKSTSYSNQQAIQLYKKTEDDTTTSLSRVDADDTMIYFTESNTLHLKGLEQGANVTIFDCAGRVVTARRACNTNELFNLSRGIYIVNIQTVLGSQTIKIAL